MSAWTVPTFPSTSSGAMYRCVPPVLTLLGKVNPYAVIPFSRSNPLS